VMHFATAYPEQLYDATYHVWVIPAHRWRDLPRTQWAADTALSRLVGSGPYRLTRWERGQYVVLEADSAATPAPGIGRVVWRFASDPDAALNLVLSGEADVLETTTSPPALARAEKDTATRVVSYPSAVFGFIAFNLRDAHGAAHPVLGDRAVRRALALAVDRRTIAAAALGPGTEVPRGPMSRLLWINSDSIRELPFDTAAAARALDEAGWKPGAGGIRMRNGRQLAFEILVPGTSRTRRTIAEALQETWRRVGARVSVAAVDFPVLQERLARGRFDAYIGAYLDEPSPRGLAEQWTRGGWGGANYGRYGNPAFDSLVSAAGRELDPVKAAAAWRAALDTMNADVPAIFLYTPTNHAVVHKRIVDVTIDPFSWLSQLPRWRIDPARALPRDSLLADRRGR